MASINQKVKFIHPLTSKEYFIDMSDVYIRSTSDHSFNQSCTTFAITVYDGYVANILFYDISNPDNGIRLKMKQLPLHYDFDDAWGEASREWINDNTYEFKKKELCNKHLQIPYYYLDDGVDLDKLGVPDVDDVDDEDLLAYTIHATREGDTMNCKIIETPWYENIRSLHLQGKIPEYVEQIMNNSSSALSSTDQQTK